MARKFKDLSEREILALAITLEEEDSRVYGDFADGLRETFPATAKMFDEMQEEESGHRRSLIETFRERFGEHIPLIRRHDVKGFIQQQAEVWLIRPLGVEHGAQAGGNHGTGNAPLLRACHRAGFRRWRAQTVGRPCRG